MHYVDALPIGAEVGQYAIESVLGQGGFGIVYRARHPVMGRVALKEFFPKSQASRVADGTIVPSTPRSQEAFSEGVKRLLAEGAKLKSFRHRNIVRVVDVFEHNHTAYLAMEEVDGMTLQSAVEGRNIIPGKEMVEDFTAQMIDALKMVHASGLVHRDVAPDNILVDLKSGAPRFVLIDFGGAKRVVTDISESSSRSLTKTGFSSPEQYGSESVGGIKATPATDVYGLAATLFWLISGRKPIDAPNRSIQDTQIRLSANSALVSTYGKSFLSGVDNGLTLRPDGRPASAEAFQETLKLGVSEKARAGNWKKPVGVLVVLALLGTGAYMFAPPGRVDPDDKAEAAAAAAAAVADADADSATAVPAAAEAAATDADSATAVPAAATEPPPERAVSDASEATLADEIAAVSEPPAPPQPVCHTVSEPQQECETKYQTHKKCDDETTSDTLETSGVEILYGQYPSRSVANSVCRPQAKKLVRAELKGDCKGGTLNDVDAECDCDWDSYSPTGASCSYEGSAECEKTEEVCEDVSEPYNECTTVHVDRQVCE